MTLGAQIVVPSLVAIMMLSACESDTYLGSERQGPPAPPGTPTITEAVDGLIVGHRLMAAGEHELALKAYWRAATEDGLTIDVLSAVGSANLKLGRLKQARTLLLRAVEEDESFVPAWNNLGVVQISLGDIEGARDSFHRAFALDDGKSEEIRQNLMLALSMIEQNRAEPEEPDDFMLVRRGRGSYLLLEV